MTNNINGIDVSECEFYNNYECDAYKHEYWEAEDNTRDMCKWHENCYFKQLKRLKQQIETYQLSENEAKEIIAELKHKNKRLQEENKRLQMLSCVTCGEKYLSPDGAELYEKNVQLQEENEELKEKKDEYYLINLDYEAKISYLIQALQEIREMLKESMSLKSNAYNHFINVEKAIDKIKEVLNDRD